MRIIVISDLPQFVTGGAEVQAAHLIEAWADAGHMVICFGRRMGADSVRLGRHEIFVKNIFTLRRFGRLLRGVSYFLSLSVLLLRYRRQVDVIYTRFLGEAALTAGFLKRFRLINALLVSTPASTGSAGSDIQFLQKLPFCRALIRLLDDQCDAINLIAPAMASELSRVGFSKNKFTYIPNGVRLRGEIIPMTQRPYRFLAVGRMTSQKGYDILIEAMAMIRERLHPGLIRIAGGGPERVALQRLAENLNVDHAIRWLGELNHNDVIQELGQTQVFLLPSRYEGMSNAGLEAMERGMAVVLSRCGGLDAYIGGDMGWIVAPESATALATTLCEAMASDVTVLSGMGELNRRQALQRFALPEVASQYLALFEILINKRNAGNFA